jgi:hypothetical protein
VQLPSASPTVREVFIDPERPFAFGDYQMNYLDYRARRMIPSTNIWYGDYLAFQTNSLGCKGKELQGGRPVIGVFGDSVVHGTSGVSFADRIDIPPCEPLNAGIEGLQLPWIVDRFLELKAKVPMVCAAVHPGWHNLVYNERGEAFWTAQLDRIQDVPVIAHFRLFADVSEATLEHGYERALNEAVDYVLWEGADITTTKEIDRFNGFLEGYCRDRGRILIDLEPLMAPKSPEAFGERFIDFVHPRSNQYDAMARQIEAQLAPAIGAALAKAPAMAQA